MSQYSEAGFLREAITIFGQDATNLEYGIHEALTNFPHDSGIEDFGRAYTRHLRFPKQNPKPELNTLPWRK